MKIRNINPEFGDCVEFDSIDEMIQALKECEQYDGIPWIPEDGLKEGRDYEVIDIQKENNNE